MRARILAALSLAIVVAGCTSSVPYFAGSRTTPSERTDVLVGTAVRSPLGAVRRNDGARTASEQTMLTLLGREGVSPVESVRYGLSDRVDVGATLSATSLSLGARRGFVLGEDTRILLGLTPHVGWLTGDDAHGMSLGIDVPAVLALNFGGVYEIWTGVRVGIDHASGRVGAIDDLNVTGFRAGGVLGLAVGLRTVAALVELAADYEWWRGTSGGNTTALSGVVLTPAFAIRIRL